jgi:para-nitrobenzyl esterase
MRGPGIAMSAITTAAIAALAACGAPDDPLTVGTTSGPVHGFRQDDSRAWLGIPFAAQPVGDLRWRPPQPAPAFTGTYEAVAIQPQCPQTFGFSPGGGDEGCLYLNVWAPASPPSDPAPVMVWFHGGAFIFGSGGDPYYSGRVLAARHGVVIVTVNYRLGPLGFLSHPALAAENGGRSGNYGVLDQVAALEWVRDNIAGFGGDPSRVTVWGESAGGLSACIHYLSPKSRGLFHAVISESGLCAGDGVGEQTPAEAEADGVSYGTEAGCPGSGADALACLRAQDAFALVDAAGAPTTTEQLPGGLFFQDANPLGWRPHVDGDLLLATTAEAFAAGDYPPAPLLLGTNRDEGTFFVWSVIARPARDEAEYRDALARRFGAADVDAIVAQYPLASYATPSLALAAVSADAFFVCPFRTTARLASAAGAPVYLYSFEREPLNGLITDGGVFHASEIPFLFGIDEFPLGKVGPDGVPLSDAMMRYWTRFATTGDPDGGDDVAWPRYDASTDRHLVLDLPVRADSGHRKTQCDFWDAR